MPVKPGRGAGFMKQVELIVKGETAFTPGLLQWS